MNRTRFVRNAIVASLLFLSCLALPGCGRSSATVNGKVTYQGKDLKGGSISFVSTEGEPTSAGTINEDGSYTVSLKAGHYKILVDTESLLPKNAGFSAKIPKDAKTMNPPPGAALPEGYKPMNIADAEAKAKENAKKYVKIPQTYASPNDTTLELNVVAGSQTHNIDLK